MKNYLDLLTTDLIELIMNYVVDLYEKDIHKLKNKLDKVRRKIDGLEIHYFAYLDYYNILYKKCFYSLNNYLFSNFRYNNVILIKDYDINFDNSLNDKEIIKMLIKENSEFKNLILEIVKKDANTINNTNTNCNNNNNINNSFNLNVFLNEKCKDAINISDFVGNIKMQMTDLENFGHLGYVEGVSRILIKNLKDLDAYSRPIHCSDFKREVLYIKDNNEWTKETDEKPVLKNVIKEVANKNIKQIQIWKQEHPDCTTSESKKNDQYINIVMNSMSGGTIDEQTNNISQIVKNISKAVIIEK